MLENITAILNLSTQWKDFFWIIFTLVATLTSLLTYMSVRKTIRQSLYDKVIEAQINVYTRLLELLEDSAENFIYSCKFGLMIRYNLIAHCVHFGFFKEHELCEKIYHSYIGQLQNLSTDEEFELESILDDIESVTIYGSDSINHGEMEVVEQEGSMPEKKKAKDVTIGIYRLTNIRGAHFHVPSFQEIYGELRSCMYNIYLPKRLEKRLGRFHQALLDIVLKRMTEIIHREEDKILSLQVGEEFTINFDSLFNELLGECKGLMKEHKLVRKEIRRLLQIDAR